MKEILVAETLKKKRLVYKKNILSWLLEFFRQLLFFSVSLLIFLTFFVLTVNQQISFIAQVFLMILSIFPIFGLNIWLHSRRTNKKRLYFIPNCLPKEAFNWATRDKYLELISNPEEGFIILREPDSEMAYYYKDIYLVFDDDKVYVSSIGNGNAPSFNKYYYNKTQSLKLVEKIQALQQRGNLKTPWIHK